LGSDEEEKKALEERKKKCADICLQLVASEFFKECFTECMSRAP